MLQVGQVLKSNGKDGDLLLSFAGIDPGDLDLQEPVFIFFDGLPVPFYFESFVRRGSVRALAHLTGIHRLKDAEELVGAALWADYFEEDETADFSGFTVKDAQGREIGRVTDCEDIPGNPCLWVRRPDGSEVLLPFHEDLLLGIDEKTGTLALSIPEGLL